MDEKDRAGTEPAPGPGRGTTVRYPVEALVRGDDPGSRSVGDSRELVRLTRYLPEGSGIRLVLHAAGGSGRVQAWLDVVGTRTVAAADLAGACAQSLVLGSGEPVDEPDPPRTVTHAYELTRIRTAPMFGQSDEEVAFRPEWMTEAKTSDRLALGQPKPSADHAEALVTALARVDHDTWVVTVLGAPSALDRGLVLDELDAATGRGVRTEHAGAIVCARTFVASAGPVSSAVLAGLARRSAELEAVPSAPHEAAAALEQSARALYGHAVAENHAVALLRVPTTTTGQGLGIPARLPDPPRRPLDPPLPAPAVPIRLGASVDVAGDPVDVTLDAQDLRRHVFVEGKTGSGKSALLKAVAVSWLDVGLPLVVLDPHGDVAATVAAHSAGRTDRVTHYVDHADLEHPVGLNLLAEPDPELWEQNVDALLESMARIIDPGRDGLFGERAKRTFWLVAAAARHVYGRRLTIHVVQTLLVSQSHLRGLVDAVRTIAPDVARRVRAELVELGDKEWNELASWYQSRFHMWQRTRALRDVTGTGVDAIDMADVLDGDVNLVVDLASTQLGDDVAGVLGGLYLRKLRDAMGRRADPDVPVLVVFDEAHLFQDEAPDRLLAEGRKYGLALVIASQSADNLTPRLARAIEANVGSFVSLRTGINLAAAASIRLGGWPAAELTRLPDLVAAASLSSHGRPTDPFTLVVDHYARAAAAGWTPTRLADAAACVASATVDALWLPYADVRVPTDAAVVAALKESAGTLAPRRPIAPVAPAAPAGRRAPTSAPGAPGWQERWLVEETTARFGRYAESPDPRLLDELYVLVGTLKIAGFERAYDAMRARLTAVRDPGATATAR
ncbi:type IV secretory system conjugative DNA transfer family protein [Cellulomonas composti]|uniref:AAA+ ATPase domain-containing protein n=1 Tax=Cellulomonas composti TaxID=266130 RepID=A0A511JD87_9CELL|nr:DUF87 domain-containing protein [Cellulomonas composti]GEL95960.1 hypothetical protein CCO02nite_26180 [Cellulomonas composti]